MTDAKYLQSFSDRQPDMAFTHMHPGLVRAPIAIPQHWAFKPLYPVIYVLTYPFSISISESAEYHLHALLVGENGSFRRGPKGDLLENKGKGYFSSEEAKKKLWEHTVEVTTVV